jgi:hypothetical protein
VLFDLRGKRKRLVQVIYAGLAVLMGGGLVLFGIGSSSNVNGGLFDALGIGSGGSKAGADYDDEADRLERRLAADPKDDALLLKLARARILAGNTKSPSDSATGQVTYSQDSVREFEQAVDAWERYLEAKPRKPDSATAILVAQTYIALAQNERSVVQAVDDIKGAAKSQKIYVEEKPSLGSYSQYALYLYLAGDIAGGDAAAKKALADATSSNRNVLKQRLEQAKKQGKQLRKQVKTAAKQEGSKQKLDNPLGGLSGGGGGIGLGGGLPGAGAPGAAP